MALIQRSPAKAVPLCLWFIWPIAQARLLGISATMLFCLLLIGFLTIVVIMRESEEGFRQLFENAADSLILHDKGRVIEVNQQTCRFLGYTREDLLQMSVFDIEVGYSKEFLFDLWERGGDVVTLSGLYRAKDGLTIPTEIRAGEITYRGQSLRLAAARTSARVSRPRRPCRKAKNIIVLCSTICSTAMLIARCILSKGGPWISFTSTSTRPSET